MALVSGKMAGFEPIAVARAGSWMLGVRADDEEEEQEKDRLTLREEDSEEGEEGLAPPGRGKLGAMG